MSTEGLVQRDEILPLLGKGVKNGSWFMAYCPAHGDGSKHGGRGGQSLGLSSKGVLRCFAGCAFEDVMAALRGGRRPEPQQERAQPRASKDGGPPWALKKAYEYRGRDGTLIAVKGRWERPNPDAKKGYDKRFSWRHPDHDWKDGISKFGLAVSEMPLWGIELVAEAAKDKPIWVCEGEAATEALRARQQVAVCGAWGASQTEFGEAFEVLRGRQVLLWPDNDKPGRDYMAHVRRALKRVAKSVTTLNPPVPPSGDAVEYFRDGGTIEQLLKGIVTKPTVDVFADNHLGVRVPTDHGVISFEFKEMFRSRGSLDCELTVRAEAEAMEDEPFWQRVNLLSASTREALIRGLGSQFGKDIEPGWATLVSIAYARCRDVFENVGPVEALSGDLAIKPAEFIIDGLAVVGGGTILYGPPGKGKSQTCMLAAISVDAGLTTLFDVPRARRVLYVNLERSAPSMQGRLALANVAMGLDPARPLLFLNARGKPLQDLLDRIRDAIRTYGVELVILDSLSRAGYGDLNDNRTANAAVDALNGLGVAWLAIGHTPRADDTHIYGSVHQDAGADVMAALTSVKEYNGDLVVGVSITKANDFNPPPQRAWRFRFDKNGLRAAERTQPESVEDLRDPSASVATRIRKYLRFTPGGATVAQIAETLGAPPNTVKSALERDREEFMQLPSGKGKAVTWVLRAKEEQPAGYTWDRNDEHCYECGEATFVFTPGGLPLCQQHSA